jgi:glycosyltransferase involved in cell wall biosynthesis
MNTLALCIPAYNAAWCLPRLLESAKKQPIAFDEILVYNDCSTDNTKEVAESFGAKVFSGKQNIGCSAGKNYLLNQTKCDYIHFHDADDVLLQNFTTLAHKWISKIDCPDVILFDYEYRDNDTNEFIAKSDFKHQELQADAIKYAILNQINPFCGLYSVDKLKSIGGYDTQPEILYNEDVAFHCKLAIAGLNFGAEKEVSIINYRISGSMSSANQLKCVQAHYEVMKINAEKVGAKYAKEIAYKAWHNATILAGFDDWETSKKAIYLAWKLYKKAPIDENIIIKIISIFNPFFAIIFREYLIRIFKSGLRK